MTAVERVETDRHVLRLGFDHLVDTGQYDAAAELLWSVWLPLWMTGHTHEAHAWTNRLHEDDLSEHGRARWLVARAGSHRVAADLFTTAERAMHLAERTDDASLAVEAAIFASAAALRLEDLDGSQTLLARADVLMKKRLDVERDVWAAVHVPIGYGDGALLRGDRPRRRGTGGPPRTRREGWAATSRSQRSSRSARRPPAARDAWTTPP